MNFIKTTITAAAVITCCLGNEMPAKALTHDERIAFNAGKDFGYAIGLAANACSYYATGQITRKAFIKTIKIANELDGTTPAIRKLVIKRMNAPSKDPEFSSRCGPIVRSVMGGAPFVKGAYRNADNWN